MLCVNFAVRGRGPHTESSIYEKKNSMYCACVWRVGENFFFKMQKKNILLLGDKKTGGKNPKK